MRGNKKFKNTKNYIDMPEKLFSCLSYLTSGMTGFIWLVISHVQGKSLSSFAKYNIFQSILISVLIYLANILLNILASVIQIIPFIGTLVIKIVYYLNQYPIIMGFSVIHSALIGLYLYMAFFAITGRYAKIPYISDMARQIG